MSQTPNVAGGNRDLRAQIEEALVRIRGVQSARVILDGPRAVTKIHLVGYSARNPKQVVRDAESLLWAHFGIPVDYRTISLVQLDAEPAPARRMAQHVTGELGRLRLLSAARDASGAVRVLLDIGGDRYVGDATPDRGDAQAAGAQAAALATLEAVGEAIDHIVRIELQGIEIVRHQADRICLVILRATRSCGEERLTGSALVIEDVLLSASEATLAALNRRLPVWVRDA